MYMFVGVFAGVWRWVGAGGWVNVKVGNGYMVGTEWEHGVWRCFYQCAYIRGRSHVHRIGFAILINSYCFLGYIPFDICTTVYILVVHYNINGA